MKLSTVLLAFCLGLSSANAVPRTFEAAMAAGSQVTEQCRCGPSYPAAILLQAKGHYLAAVRYARQEGSPSKEVKALLRLARTTSQLQQAGAAEALQTRIMTRFEEEWGYPALPLPWKLLSRPGRFTEDQNVQDRQSYLGALHLGFEQQLAAGAPDEALAYADRIVAVKSELLHPNHDQVGWAHELRARALEALGDRAAGLRVRKQVLAIVSKTNANLQQEAREGVADALQRIQAQGPGNPYSYSRPRVAPVSFPRSQFVQRTFQLTSAVDRVSFSERDNDVQAWATSTPEGYRIWSIEDGVEVARGDVDGREVSHPLPNVGRYHQATHSRGSREVRITSPSGETRTVTHTLFKKTMALKSSRDGTKLLTSGWDSTIRVFDLRGTYPRLMVTLIGHGDIADSVDFSPSGELAASGGRDGRVVVWRIPG